MNGDDSLIIIFVNSIIYNKHTNIHMYINKKKIIIIIKHAEKIS